jgi:hypothetical protein
MNCQGKQARPYCPGVRVGNWFEDIALEEDIVRDYLDKRERGELLGQRQAGLTDFAHQKVELSISRDGKVHFGDVIMVINPQTQDCSRCNHALSMTLNEDAIFDPKASVCSDTKDVTASALSLKPTLRSTFVIRSCDGSHNGETLRYNQPFYLSTSDGKLFLTSDHATFMQSAKKSRHNKVWLGSPPTHLSEWRILPYDPQFRMELEHHPVPANSKVIFNHVKTNKNLCLEKYFISTYFGKEQEVSCNTEVDSHRAEIDTNHWMLTMSVPGSDILDVSPPEENDLACNRSCQELCNDGMPNPANCS